MEKLIIRFGDLSIEAYGISVWVSIFLAGLVAFGIGAWALYAKNKIAYDSDIKQQSSAVLPRKM
jgi:prolipoprotein diacylglyceryltransferase